MSFFMKFFKYLFNANYRWIVNANMGLYNNISDEDYIKRKFKICFGRELNLQKPVTYNEKLQWLKLYNRVNDYSKMVDKCDAKEYVGNIIGFEHVVPLYGVWNRFEDINFNNLPNQFVLKCTHDCGGLVIVKDKKNLDVNAAKKIINKSLKTNYYYYSREWPYKNVRPRIIAEKYLEDKENNDLVDYKFFCFDGEVKALFIATDRQNPIEETKFDFFDIDFNHLPFKQGHNNSLSEIKKPAHFNEMIMFAEKLSKGIPHVRCDFYEVNGNVYFGEMTFFHYGGFVQFEPDEWDKKFGDWIKIPNMSQKE